MQKMMAFQLCIGLLICVVLSGCSTTHQALGQATATTANAAIDETVQAIISK